MFDGCQGAYKHSCPIKPANPLLQQRQHHLKAPGCARCAPLLLRPCCHPYSCSTVCWRNPCLLPGLQAGSFGSRSRAATLADLPSLLQAGFRGDHEVQRHWRLHLWLAYCLACCHQQHPFHFRRLDLVCLRSFGLWRQVAKAAAAPLYWAALPWFFWNQLSGPYSGANASTASSLDFLFRRLLSFCMRTSSRKIGAFLWLPPCIAEWSMLSCYYTAVRRKGHEQG